MKKIFLVAQVIAAVLAMAVIFMHGSFRSHDRSKESGYIFHQHMGSIGLPPQNSVTASPLLSSSADGTEIVVSNADGNWLQFIRRSGLFWGAQSFIKLPNNISCTSIAMSRDGRTVFVGLNERIRFKEAVSAVYIYGNDKDKWHLTDKITLDKSDGFEENMVSLSVANDADIFVAGVTTQPVGKAYIYHVSGKKWIRRATLEPANKEEFDNFGHATAMSADAGVIMVDDSDQDLVYVFRKNGETWSGAGTIHYKRANGFFGLDIAMSASGNTFVTRDSISVYVYDWDKKVASWQPDMIFALGDNAANTQAAGISLSRSGNVFAIGLSDTVYDPENGRVIVFKKINGKWKEQERISGRVGNETRYEPAVAMSEDGEAIVVGGGEGSGLTTVDMFTKK